MTYDDRSRFRFAPPEEIAARTGARSVRGGFKDGLCPSCGESKLKVAWGRDRGRTIVRCHADAPCQQTEVLSAFSKQGLSLVIKGADAADPGKPRRHLSETAGLDPIDRALWHLSKAELRLYQWLKRRGDGPAKFRDMPFGRSAKRAAPVLEHLGLVRVKRGRFDPNGGGREANGYEVARVRPFHPLPPEDSLRALRRSLKQNLNDGAQPFYTCTSSSHGATVAPIRTCWLSDVSDVHGRQRAPGRAELSRRRRASRLAGAGTFASAVGRMVLARADGMWEGRWRELLLAVPRPAGSRAWPISRGGIQSSLWLGRDVLRELGLRCEWVHSDGVSGRRVLRAIRISPTLRESPSGLVEQRVAEMRRKV